MFVFTFKQVKNHANNFFVNIFYFEGVAYLSTVVDTMHERVN